MLFASFVPSRKYPFRSSPVGRVAFAPQTLQKKPSLHLRNLRLLFPLGAEMPTSTIPSKSLFVVSPSSSSTSANIESPVVPREWSVTGYHSYLKAVQLIDPGPVRLSSGRRSSRASLTLGSSSEAMSADEVGELGQSLYRPDLRKRILFSGTKLSFARFDIGRSPTILDLSNSGVDPSMARRTSLSIGRPVGGRNYLKGLT